MLSHLVASNPDRAYVADRIRITAVSVLLHALVVLVLIKASLPKPQGIGVHPDTTLVFLESDAMSLSAAPTQRAALAAFGQDFRSLQIPTIVPVTIPSIQLQESLGDPKAYSKLGTADGLSGVLAEGGGGDDGGAEPGSGGVYRELGVDEKPRIVSTPKLEYPAALRGIGGLVKLQAIIDTLGRVEPNSVVILSSTAPGFEAPAKDAVLKSVFRPGRVGGRPVRVLVQLPITFSVGR